jgi:hypothetical protein
MSFKNHTFQCKRLEEIAGRLISKHLGGIDYGPNAFAKQKAWEMFASIDRGATSAHQQLELERLCMNLDQFVPNDPQPS